VRPSARCSERRRSRSGRPTSATTPSRSQGPWLSTPFVAEDFAFSSRSAAPSSSCRRWKRCLRETDGDLGEALGQAYVTKTFPPEARARARAVIDDIRAAFGERLQHLTWMSDSTRTQALGKLARMREKVGYPDQWRDYTRLVAQDGPFILNVARGQRIRVAAGGEPPRRSGGHDRVGGSPYPRQRLLRSLEERDGIPRRRAGAADVRPRCRRRRQLRLTGGELGRARTHARVRRRRPALRRRRQSERFGGRRPTPRTSPSRRIWSLGSSTGTSRWTRSTRTGSSPWARISPTSAGCSPGMTRSSRR